MMKKKTSNLLLLLAVSVCLGGCGGGSPEEKELADFSSAISQFTAIIKDVDERINAIDTTSEYASEELLGILDELEQDFKDLAKIPVPEQYQSIEELADEASTNMTTAVSCYHDAYDAEVFSEADADAAYQYYTRAMTRVRYIGYILVGEIPEDENITIHEEMIENKLLDKLLHDNDETIEDLP